MMDNKILTEIANDIAAACPDLALSCCSVNSSCVSCLADALYELGYRKQNGLPICREVQEIIYKKWLQQFRERKNVATEIAAVVRCKDCTHFRLVETIYGTDSVCNAQGDMNVHKAPDDFCSWGEKIWETI